MDLATLLIWVVVIVVAFAVFGLILRITKAAISAAITIALVLVVLHVLRINGFDLVRQLIRFVQSLLGTVAIAS